MKYSDFDLLWQELWRKTNGVAAEKSLTLCCLFFFFNQEKISSATVTKVKKIYGILYFQPVQVISEMSLIISLRHSKLEKLMDWQLPQRGAQGHGLVLDQGSVILRVFSNLNGSVIQKKPRDAGSSCWIETVACSCKRPSTSRLWRGALQNCNQGGNILLNILVNTDFKRCNRPVRLVSGQRHWYFNGDVKSQKPSNDLINVVIFQFMIKEKLKVFGVNFRKRVEVTFGRFPSLLRNLNSRGKHLKGFFITISNPGGTYLCAQIY